ncbi:hypothetical protein FC093_08040 [Ilyomonas limi]|uniref:TonB-dependent receptor plug domain-containing protein n=1 Tax=Ilyomonas limi TaxID=2575867 RepID=A0A4U3L4K2_9BACT|nr:TonB-dependent receptor plug domain-containing protein [Ilyomonas limi]TKK69259.1 hypothetical protein FC093_08040 [Ilyomonas limi]
MCIRNIFYLLMLLVFTISASAQDASTTQLDSFSAKFITAIRANAKERAYLVADKSVYKVGDFIWFNAFLLNTASQKLSSKSSFLFVDVVDENDNIINRIVLDAANQQLHSRIHLPDTLAGGYYWLRAYTRQMAAYDSNNIAVKPLYVLDKAGAPVINKPVMNSGNKQEMPILTFYPEGGNIITGIDATVAVMVSDKEGTPLSITGVIKDNKDAVITNFTTNANGLGKFKFEPSGFRQYKAVLNDNGKEWNYPLPPFDFYKGQLAVTRRPGVYQLRILLGDSIYNKNVPSYVVGISKDSLVFAAVGKGQYQVNVDENKLPPGIVTFYLFDKDFNMLSERAVYANNNNVQTTIITDKSNYTKRDKVSLQVEIADGTQHPVPALISISVRDSLFAYTQPCTLPQTAAIRYMDDLFFATHNCFSDEEKDLLMLARNNTYTKLTTPVHSTVILANDSLFYISGKVQNGKNEVANTIVTFISNAGSNGLFYTDTTDDTGRFRFALESYPDSMQYALEVKDLDNRVLNADIIPEAIALPQLKTPTWLKQPLAMPKPTIDKLARRYYLQWEEDDHHLPLVTVKDEKADYDVSKRVSPFSTILSGSDFDGRTSVDNLVLKVRGLQLVNGYLVMRGLFSMRGSGASFEPLLLVDGVPVYVAATTSIGNTSPVLSYLSTLNPKDIDFIEVLSDGTAANYGVRGANGVILVNTSAKSRDFRPGNNMRVFYAKGIARPMLFPVSIYNEKNKKAAVQQDTRSTLFWNGHFVTSESGDAAFTFYTSDVPATYIATVTGITRRGDIIYKTISFQSK